MFEIIEIDGATVSIGGDFDETLVWGDQGPGGILMHRPFVTKSGRTMFNVVAAGTATLVHVQAQAPVTREKTGCRNHGKRLHLACSITPRRCCR